LKQDGNEAMIKVSGTGCVWVEGEDGTQGSRTETNLVLDQGLDYAGTIEFSDTNIAALASFIVPFLVNVIKEYKKGDMLTLYKKEKSIDKKEKTVIVLMLININIFEKVEKLPYYNGKSHTHYNKKCSDCKTKNLQSV
jgi:hypothetical protein